MLWFVDAVLCDFVPHNECHIKFNGSHRCPSSSKNGTVSKSVVSHSHPLSTYTLPGTSALIACNNNNKDVLYSSQREIKAVVRSHNEEHISVILVTKHTHIHTLTLRHTPPFSQSAYTNSKPQITRNNAFSVKPKRKNSQIKSKS